MIESLIHLIQQYLIPLGGMGVFVASVMEEIVAPIPSAMVIFASGFLLVTGPLSLETFIDLLLTVAIPAALGVTIGSLFAYGIAYYAGKPVLTKWGKWLGLTWDDIERMHQKFSESKFDEWSLFAIRALPIVPSVVISAFCGLVRFPIRSYLIISFVGLLVRTTILGFLGWQVGKLYVHYAQVVALFEDVILYSVIGCVVAFIVWRVYRYQVKKRNVI